MKTPERRQWRRSGVSIVNFEHISHLLLVFLLWTLNKSMLAGIGPTRFLALKWLRNRQANKKNKGKGKPMVF